MKIENYLDRKISKELREENDERNKNHKSSGKLSASMLGYPLQWMILKNIGAERKDIDDYTLRKFRRGEHVEEWLISFMDNIIDEQVFCEYRGVIGYLDALVSTKGYDFPLEKEMPHEIKSVTNMRFKYLNEPQESHALQGALYALGLGKDFFVIDYVASGDYRVKSFVLGTRDYKETIDTIIEEYNKAMKEWEEDNIIPVFESKAKWQENKKYSQFPSYTDLTSEEAYEIYKKQKSNVEEVK